MTLLQLLVLLIVIVVIGIAAYYLIDKFFKDAMARNIALLIVGTILLIVLLSQFFPGLGSFRVWSS